MLLVLMLVQNEDGVSNWVFWRMHKLWCVSLLGGVSGVAWCGVGGCVWGGYCLLLVTCCEEVCCCCDGSC